MSTFEIAGCCLGIVIIGVTFWWALRRESREQAAVVPEGDGRAARVAELLQQFLLLVTGGLRSWHPRARRLRFLNLH
jgi:hypothetical protein